MRPGRWGCRRHSSALYRSAAYPFPGIIGSEVQRIDGISRIDDLYCGKNPILMTLKVPENPLLTVRQTGSAWGSILLTGPSECDNFHQPKTGCVILAESYRPSTAAEPSKAVSEQVQFPNAADRSQRDERDVLERRQPLVDLSLDLLSPHHHLRVLHTYRPRIDPVGRADWNLSGDVLSFAYPTHRDWCGCAGWSGR